MANKEHDRSEKEVPSQGSQNTGAGRSPASVQNVESTNSRSEGDNAQDQAHAMKHNVQGEQAHRHPDTPAGQHATGSFLDETADKKP